MKYGLSSHTINTLKTIFSRYQSIEKVIIFGSRAIGNYREGSDIDLAIIAPDMSDNEFGMLWDEIQEAPLIYKIDLLHLEKLSNQKLKEKIKVTGLIL